MTLGFLFVCGQIEAWRELAAAGIYLPTNPSASFFYILTAAHAVHLLGGLFALQYANRQAAAVYWHFMTGLWIYVLLLFFIWG
jgi:cytochrome c oxidase subunit III